MRTWRTSTRSSTAGEGASVWALTQPPPPRGLRHSLPVLSPSLVFRHCTARPWAMAVRPGRARGAVAQDVDVLSSACDAGPPVPSTHT